MNFIICSINSNKLKSKMSLIIICFIINVTFLILFQIGQLSAQNLDYEKRSAYTLQVQATDGANTATASVSITVVDDKANPEPPHFAPYTETVTVTEGSAAKVVKDLTVTTASAGSFTCDFGFDVTPSILEYFTVNTRISSCAVETRKPLKWTKEVPSYKFTVRIITKSNPRQWSSALLVVNIDDVNDHAPEFTQDSYVVSVHSSAKLGSSVLQLKATDKDDKRNGEVSYRLMAKGDSSRFAIFSLHMNLFLRKVTVCELYAYVH